MPKTATLKTEAPKVTAKIAQKTFSISEKNIKRDWFTVDAKDKTLGRLASEIAIRLRGKHKPEYTPHMDTGDYIIVLNAGEVKVTGNKRSDKTYYHHTGFPGGLKSITFDKLLKKDLCKPLRLAVWGMLPKGPLGRKMFRKLKTYSGTEHMHTAQQPQELSL